MGQCKKQGGDTDLELRVKVERAKQLIRKQVEKDDPDTTEFVRQLLEQFPDIASMEDKRWHGKWAAFAKRYCIKFGMSIVGKLIRELVEKL